MARVPITLQADDDLLRRAERVAAARNTSVAEMLVSKTSERQGRVIDRDAGSASMEKKKQEGYF